MSLLPPARAADLAEDAARGARDEYDAIAQCWPEYVPAWVDAFTGGSATRPKQPPLIDSKTYRRILGVCQDMAVVRRWRQHRVVYTVESTLADELAATDPEDMVPGGLVRQLPHLNPFLALPAPVVVPVAGRPEVVHYYGAFLYGAFLYGETRTALQCSTDDSRARVLHLAFPGFVHDEHGRRLRQTFAGRRWVLDMTWSRISINGDESARMADVITDAIGRFASASRMQRGVPESHLVVTSLLARTVPLVIYLCAANAERRLAPNLHSRKRGDGGPRSIKQPTVVEHGYYLGPALTAARRQVAAKAAAEPTGRRMRPHVRRAHWHTYRTGPGRTENTVHWLPPIPVHPEDETTKPTIVPVATGRT